MRSGVGDIKSKSKSVGDIIVVTPNPNIMDLIITNVVDPRGIRELILALKKNVLAQLDR
jgi:hypothetical protein